MENKNQPAFAAVCDNTNPYLQEGLTKREYFAAMAMQGLLSNPEWMKEYKGEKYLMESDIVAELAIKNADAVLEALSTPSPTTK